jgi:CxxC motif-containing protein (DUF1111 family)
MHRHRIASGAKCALSFIGLALSLAITPAGFLFGQSDPGPRPGPPSAGRPLPGLTPTELATFQAGLQRFTTVDTVGTGLGPRFNANSCVSCHSQPIAGGSSPSLHSPQNPQVNPQIAMATLAGAQNAIPSFVQPDGPVVAVRFVTNPDGTPDGGVHDLFVISGRTDAGTCSIAQPDFAGALAANNLILRIPTPLFGAGLIEAIADGAILANQAANAALKTALGISGYANRSANDGTITRFGWKAQNKSLLMFAGEAYNVEIGVTNELFPSERDVTPSCLLNPLPEDQTDFTQTSPVAAISDILGFSEFMRWLAPPAPAQAPPPAGPVGPSAPPQPPQNPAVARGQQVFNLIGCALCHTPVMTTGTTTSAALSNRPVALYSDLLVHHMGAGLADGVTQGLATGDEFRSAPLWGLGQRIYFLHDGRTTDLTQAIGMHASPGSEATAVVGAYQALPPQDVQDLLTFLRSL